MRHEVLYLTDIVEAADAIQQFLVGVRRQRFLGDDLIRSAVLHKLAVIGEAAAHLSPDIRQHHADIPWSDIVAFRNFAVHAYFAIDWSIVWATATHDVPPLRQQIARILADEYPDSSQVASE